MSLDQIVIDTNVIVSSLKSRRGASFKLVFLVASDLFEISLSVPLAMEYEEVLIRHQEHLVFSRSDIEHFLNYLCSQARHHDVYFLWRPVLKDPSDDMILELAVTSRSGCIVTFNKQDFAQASRFNIQVTTPKEFLKSRRII